MTRQYSPRHLLKYASNRLLARYFAGLGLLSELDIANLAETKIDPVYDAIQDLAPADKAHVDSDLLLVHSLADEQGLRAILDEATYRGIDLASDLEGLAGFHDKALWTLLEHPGIVEVASKFSDADHLPNAYWHRRREGVPVGDAHDDATTCEELAHAIASYYRVNEGRGRECEVEVYRRGAGWYFIALPEDYAETSMEYEDDGLQRRPRRPVFEVVFVYDPERQVLDIFARGQKQTRLELEKLFGRIVLHHEIEAQKSDKVYDLNRFKQRGLKFIYDPAAGIADVSVSLLRMSLIGSRRRLTFEADPSDGRDGIYNFVEEVFGRPGNGKDGHLSIALANVTRVGIHVTFAHEGRRRKPTKTFYLTYPDGCTLGHDGRDAVLRQMLIDSKIEAAKAPTPVAAG